MTTERGGVTPHCHVAFVRAVMIGREGLHRSVLLDLFTAAGATDATSYISTGNVSFSFDGARLPALIDGVEGGIEEVVGRRTEVFVRSLDELRATLHADPFGASPFDEPRERIVTFFRDSVPATLELPIVSKRGDFHVFAAGPGEVFSVTREVDGRMQAPGGLIERVAGERATSRAWSTIERIVDKLTT